MSREIQQSLAELLAKLPAARLHCNWRERFWVEGVAVYTSEMTPCKDEAEGTSPTNAKFLKNTGQELVFLP
jgi:hypothetical protein